MKKSFSSFVELTRAYSLPLSLSSWFVAVCYSLGYTRFSDIILTLITILCLHMAGNLFDDLVDVKNELKKTKGELSSVCFNIGSNKARLILDGTYSFRDVYSILFILFAIPFIIGLYYTIIIGPIIPILALIIFGICLFYPISAKYKVSDILISLLTGPSVLYCTYLVLTYYTPLQGSFYSLGFFSISLFLIILSLSIMHSLMDWEHDEERGKITLCRMMKTKNNALWLMGVLLILAYINVCYLAILGVISKYFLLVLFTIPLPIKLVQSMYDYINCIDKPLVPKWYYGPMEGWKNIEQTGNKYFIFRFLLGRNVLLSFSFWCGIIFIISNFFWFLGNILF